MIVNNFNKTTILEYSSVYDAIESQKGINKLINIERAKQTTEGNEGVNWYGIEGGAKAVLSMVDTGYPEGAAMVAHFHDTLKGSVSRAEGIKRRIVRGPMGDSLDIHSVNRGALDRAWTSTRRSVRKGSGIVRVTVDVCGDSSASVEMLRWRGVAALALCEILTSAGYSVEIVAALGVKNYCKSDNHVTMAATIMVKPRNVRPDYDMVAATVCLPGFFRTIGFNAVVQAADVNGKGVYSGLGEYEDVSKILPIPEKVTQFMVNASVINHESATDFCNSAIKVLQG